jgi:hypothetical protein
MYINIKYFYKRLIKKHIDAALMKRKVASKLKRSRIRGLYKPISDKPVSSSMTSRVFRSKPQESIAVLPLVEYKDLYTDVNYVHPSDLLVGIPTLQALEFIVTLQNKVVYAYSDIKTQQKLLAVMHSLLESSAANKLDDFIAKAVTRGQYPVLIDNYSCLLFYLLALQNYDPSNRNLTDTDKRQIFKAYLFCSHVWLDHQQKDIKGLTKIELSLRVDLPIVEFKTYKDFKSQLYKASRFFLFCEKNELFGKFAQWFFNDRGFVDASDYLMKIFNLFSHTTHHPTPVYIGVTQEQVSSTQFFDQYVINPVDFTQAWDRQEVLRLRNSFMLKIPDADTGGFKYMVLNSMLLIDKLYQGMMFDFADSVINHGGGYANGTPFKNKGDFNGLLGEVFSERHILYDTMELAFPQSQYIKLSGEQMKNKGVVGEPDYCLIDDHRMFLFEYKDVMLNDAIKQSTDIDSIKTTILDRVCKLEGKRQKGAGQILKSIDNFFNHKALDVMGVDISGIKEVFPIVVTTDTSFNALGVNALVKQEFARLKKESGISIPVRVLSPVIMDFDTLFNLIIPLREQRLNMGNLLYQYINKCSHPYFSTMPFCGFVNDDIRVPLLKKEDIQVIFGDLLRMIKST